VSMRSKFLHRAILVLACLFAVISAQPRLMVERPFGYQVGDRIDPELFVLDKHLTPHTLLSLIKPETRIVILVGIGGAASRVPEGKPFRGPLWCEDSFDDLSLQRALVAQYRHGPVQFIGVAVPPVYNPLLYGYAENVFLGKSDDSPEFLENTRLFIEKTERQIRSRLIPTQDVYYDPKYRLAGKLKSGEGGEFQGERYPWEGKLRWHRDPRNYGLPIVWLLGPQGEILQEPFFSNDYDSDPPQVRYEFRDVKAAIDSHLEPGVGSRVGPGGSPVRQE
jgi:hypothetical protein